MKRRKGEFVVRCTLSGSRGTPLSQETGPLTSANVICCSSVDFSGAILVYTCRKFPPESLGMRI